MSSGRDEMMIRWSEEINLAEQHIRESQKEKHNQRLYQRLVEYRQTLINEITRIDKLMKELRK